MALKIFRTFAGGYEPDHPKLVARGYLVVPQAKCIITSTSVNHGYGKIDGTTKKLGANYSPVPVCLFRRSTRTLIWETTSKPDGSYSFRNVAVGLDCFVIAFDPNEQYNAVIQDKITPYDGRLT